MTKGILIQALGHHNYYQMAVVLAASIKANDPDIPVCLVTDHTVAIAHAKLFDWVTFPIEESITNKGKKEYIKAKLFMYDYSPFDETIFMDVDQIVISGRKLSTVFDELKDIDITFSNTGIANISIWAKIEEVKELYGDKPFWNFHSEFVYFKKNDEVKNYFEVAKMVYNEAEIQSALKFANGSMADELAFQCAAMITGIYPHKENWTPNFWFDRHPKQAYKYPYELVDNITYSIGGKSNPQHVKTCYNTLAKAYFVKLGLLNPYQVVDKRTYLPERRLI